jgi:predicted RNase H-like nuclease
MSIILGLAVFAIIVAIGWRSVQNRRILRLQGVNGQETIIVASEDDDISSIVTTTTTASEPAQPAPAPAPTVVVVNTGTADAPSAPEFGRKADAGETLGDAGESVVGPDRLAHVVSAAK